MTLILLGKIAVTDWKYKIIPNQYLLLGMAIRGILLLPEMILDFFGTWQQLCYDFAGSAAVAASCLLIRSLSKQGIGMGDVKLLVLLSLWIGREDSLNVIFFAFCIFFVQACVCLITKQKRPKDSLPFGPAVFAGMVVVIFIGGMGR